MKRLIPVVMGLIFFIMAMPVCAGQDTSLKGKIVVVDPGHGGYDPGTIKGGVCEKHINLQIGQKLKKALENKGVTAILTHDGDYNLAITGLHAKMARRYDLNQRLKISEDSKAALYVSIHANSARNKSIQGAEVFYNPKSEKSKRLAEVIQDQLRSIPGMEKRMAKLNDYYVLKNATVPAVLVEVGYLSNPQEREKLINAEYQTLLSDKISIGIKKFLTSRP